MGKLTPLRLYSLQHRFATNVVSEIAYSLMGGVASYIFSPQEAAKIKRQGRFSYNKLRGELAPKFRSFGTINQTARITIEQARVAESSVLS